MLLRSGQPEVGWLGWRSAEDEELIKAVSEACAANRLSAEAPAPTAANGHVNGDVPSLRDLSEEALLFKNTEVSPSHRGGSETPRGEGAAELLLTVRVSVRTFEIRIFVVLVRTLGT